MRKSLSAGAIAVLLLSACSKGKDATAPAATPAPEPKPTASFKVVNAAPLNNGGAALRELQTLTIQNTSTNAVSYSWDLSTAANYSDGVIDQPMRYSDKTEPSNIYMIPCMQDVTITLTAKNKTGDVSTSSQTFTVQCFRGTGGRHPVMHKLY